MLMPRVSQAIEAFRLRLTSFVLFFCISPSPPMGPVKVPGYQSCLLHVQRCYPACGHLKDPPISPLFSFTLFLWPCMFSPLIPRQPINDS